MIDHWQQANKVIKELHAHGYEGYLVGGAVRDLLLNNIPKDFDVVTNATPEQIAAIPAFTKASYTDPAQAFGVTRVRLANDEKHNIEIATYRRDVEAHLGRKLTKVEFSHIEEDLARRDFTINALALDPHNSFLVDLYGGLYDLESRIVRFIGDPVTRIKEDPLRILRAVRFCSQLGFNYDTKTKRALQTAIRDDVLSEIAIDRVRDELTRMLVHPSRHAAIEDMDELGIIEKMLPELSACKGVEQPKSYHAEGDVWTHTLLSIDSLPQNPSPRLAWATLLHDVGKAPTATAPDTPADRIHFNNHHRVGAELARAVAERLNFPKQLTEDVAWLIHYHLITDDFPEMRPSRRHFYMSHHAFHDLLDLHAADIYGSRSNIPKSNGDHVIEELEKMWQKYRQQSQKHTPSLKEALGIDGTWVKQHYDISSGPKLGTILTELNEEFLDGTIITLEDVREKITELLK